MGAKQNNLLAVAIGLLTAGPLYAAGLKVDILVNGQPAVGAGILLDGTSIGESNDNGSFWHQGFEGGRHTLTLVTDRERIPYSFFVEDEEAAIISISQEDGQSDIQSVIDRVPLS